jgi:hypothetical protein
MATQCCYVDSSCDGPSVSRTERRRARKDHDCCECREPIRKGDEHEVVTGCWDGRWDEFRTCLLCVRIREDFFPWGWNYGNLAEDFLDCQGWDYRKVPEDGGPDPEPDPRPTLWEVVTS